MKIVMSELENLCNAMITRIEHARFLKVPISEDFYWDVFFNEACKYEKKPELVVGSLVDDWQSLGHVLSGISPMTDIDFYRLGSVITAIGNEVFAKSPHEAAPNDLLVNLSDIKRFFTFIFTAAKTEKFNINILDVAFDKYWRVDLDCMYASTLPTAEQITLSPLLENLSDFTKYVQSGALLGLKEFEQLGSLIKVIGTTGESVQFLFIDIKNI